MLVKVLKEWFPPTTACSLRVEYIENYCDLKRNKLDLDEVRRVLGLLAAHDGHWTSVTSFHTRVPLTKILAHSSAERS